MFYYFEGVSQINHSQPQHFEVKNLNKDKCKKTKKKTTKTKNKNKKTTKN